MVTVPALGGITASCISAWTRHLRRADRAAAPEPIGLSGQSARAAHAQGADANEPANPPCHQRHYRGDWPCHCGRHSGWTTDRRRARQAAGSTHQSRYRDHPKIPGRQLAARASVYPRSIARSVSHLSATNRELRSGNRENAARVRAPHGPGGETFTTRPEAKSRREQKEKEKTAIPTQISISVPKPTNSSEWM